MQSLSDLYNTNNRAISPVIGVILMVAITVILATAVGTFTLGQSDNVNENPPTTQIETEQTEPGTIQIHLRTSSRNLNPDEITVTAEGNSDITYNGTLEKAGDTITVTNVKADDQLIVSHNAGTKSHVLESVNYQSSLSDISCDGSTYYVAKDAGDKSCTYTTIQNAVDNSADGDNIDVKAGTYDEQTLVIPMDKTLDVKTTDDAVITASNTDGSNGAIHLESRTAGTTVTGFTIDSQDADHGIYAESTATIDDVTITGTGINAINARDEITVTNSHTNGHARGVKIASYSPSTITGNTMKNHSTGVNTRSETTVSNNKMTELRYGVKSNGAGSVIEDNTINPSFYGVYIGDNDQIVRHNKITGDYGEGIKTEGTVTNTTMTYNVIRGGQTGILLSAQNAGTHDVTNNVMYNHSNYDLVDDDGTETDSIVANGNYWGHNDGDSTNSDCTPVSTRLNGDVTVDSALCDAPSTAGPD